MNIAAEKEEIIRQFSLIHDEHLIKAIKSLLDFGLHRQECEELEDEDVAMNESME